MSAPPLDESKIEAFGEKMMEVFNGGALALMTSVGHRTGLFDTLATLPPSTSHEIAEKGGLNERYVREWLGAMATGGVVEYEESTELYRLPPEHAALLTRTASPDNMAVTAQFLPLLALVEDEVIECFRNGGGVPYSSFPRFHEVMAEDSHQSVVLALIDSIVPLVPGLKEKLETGIDVLDVGCGSGWGMIRLAEEFPNSRFVGYDFSPEGIGRANAKAEKEGLKNVRFEVKDVSKIGETERYDWIATFDAIHDQADPAGVLTEIRNALRPDGVYLCQDIRASSHVHKNLDHPIGPFLYTISCMHCMTVSLALDGEGLGTVWGEETAVRMLSEAGFEEIQVETLEHDFQNNYYIARKG